MHKCDYCGFYSLPFDEHLAQAYLKRVEEQLRMRVLPYRDRIATVFVGGGNPTSLGAANFGRLLAAIVDVTNENRIIEWTIETNPETCVPAIIQCMADIPKLRLSIGVQRLHDDELKVLGRIGTVRQARAALEIARQRTDRVSIDLMLGIPGLPSLANEMISWVHDFQLEHISTYLLSVESDTPLARSIQKGIVADPDDVGPDELSAVIETAAECDLQQYEVSNFANAGGECLHNLHYWHGGDYLGVGPAAVGTLVGKRTTQPDDLNLYCLEFPEEVEILNREMRYQESVMLRLRLIKEGLSLKLVKDQFSEFASRLILSMEKHLRQGSLRLDQDVLSVTQKGLPMLNQILSDLI